MSDQLAFKGAIYYVNITTVISSRVKITCYLHVWRCEVLAGNLTWYFTGVYIIKSFSLRHCVTSVYEAAPNFAGHLHSTCKVKLLTYWKPSIGSEIRFQFLFPTGVFGFFVSGRVIGYVVIVLPGRSCLLLWEAKRRTSQNKPSGLKLSE